MVVVSRFGCFFFVFELKKARFFGAFLKCFFYLDTTRHYFRRKSGRVVGLRTYSNKGYSDSKKCFLRIRFQKKDLPFFQLKVKVKLPHNNQTFRGEDKSFVLIKFILLT